MRHYKPIPELTPNQTERFWSRVVRTDTCWLWTGLLNGRGYGFFSVWKYGNLFAHRVAYTLLVGAIPDGMTLDHVRERGCINKNCVNPDHLEPVTVKENILRGDGPTARNSRKTHCKRGHEFTPGNTIIRSGFRQCLACRQIANPKQVNPKRARPPRTIRSKTHCQRGHEFTSENTYYKPDGSGRECIKCKRMRRRGIR